MTSPQPETPAAAPRPPKTRRWSKLWLVLPVVAVLYAVVVLLYASNPRATGTTDVGEPPPGAVIVEISPQSVSPTGEALTALVSIAPSPELENSDQITLKQDISVVVSPATGEQTLVFPAGSIPATKTVTVLAAGEAEKWPFDVYRPRVAVVAYTPDGGLQNPIPADIYITGNLPGWTTDAHLRPPSAVGGANVSIVEMTITRSGSTVAFAILLLGLMVVLPVLVLFVAINTYRGRRKFEATLTSWMGTMLFAIIPLRSFLPGAPPIGSWIDYLIVIWVIAALITGLTIYVTAWHKWGTTPGAPTPLR